MYDRLYGLFGEDKLNILADKKILLVGVGGVGSGVFEVLIRSGIKNITIIDFDTYEKSNLNRQLNSLEDVIGKKKVEVMKKHAKMINPSINVIALDEYLKEDSDIDLKEFDFIIDACDSVNAKAMLIEKAFANNVRIITSLGVGNRVNPTQFTITKLDKVTSDPLGKKLRNYLKKANFNEEVIVLASKEVPIKSNPVSSYIAVSLTAGILIADYVIKELLK